MPILLRLSAFSHLTELYSAKLVEGDFTNEGEVQDRHYAARPANLHGPHTTRMDASYSSSGRNAPLMSLPISATSLSQLKRQLNQVEWPTSRGAHLGGQAIAGADRIFRGVPF